jgi:hypothetical protein
LLSPVRQGVLAKLWLLRLSWSGNPRADCHRRPGGSGHRGIRVVVAFLRGHVRHGKSGIIARLDPARTDRVTPRSPSVPDVTHDEPRLLACPANERLRHAHPDAEMSIMAAPFETGGTPTAITDGGGMADMQRVSNRQCSAI